MALERIIRDFERLTALTNIEHDITPLTGNDQRRSPALQLHVGRLDSCQFHFHQPTPLRPVDVSRRAPATACERIRKRKIATRGRHKRRSNVRQFWRGTSLEVELEIRTHIPRMTSPSFTSDSTNAKFHRTVMTSGPLASCCPSTFPKLDGLLTQSYHSAIAAPTVFFCGRNVVSFRSPVREIVTVTAPTSPVERMVHPGGYCSASSLRLVSGPALTMT